MAKKTNSVKKQQHKLIIYKRFFFTERRSSSSEFRDSYSWSDFRYSVSLCSKSARTSYISSLSWVASSDSLSTSSWRSVVSSWPCTYYWIFIFRLTNGLGPKNQDVSPKKVAKKQHTQKKSVQWFSVCQKCEHQSEFSMSRIINIIIFSIRKTTLRFV